MEWILITIAAILLIVSIIGSIIPALPGPPLAFVALLLLQFTNMFQFSIAFLVIWGIIVTIVTVLDFYLPVWATKKFGGSKSGVNGSIIGMIIGLFFTPIGIVLGTLLGAIIGELTTGADFGVALKSGLGTFIGTMFGMGIKLIVCSIFIIYFIAGLF